MKRSQRAGFTLFQLLVLLAILAILLALLLPAVAKVREAAARTQSQNNLKQIGIACHNYHDVNGTMPPGVDANGFSASTYLLPFIEQNNVFQIIDLKKSIDDKANAPARATQIKVFLSPQDVVGSVTQDFGATNYLFNAGSKPDLADNDGVFFKSSKVHFADIVDGTSNTLMAGETLKGDAMVKAIDMRRQHVLLKKDALKGIKEDTGVDDWKNDKNIAANRCASWMDGHFLQGTFSGTRSINDSRPDVSCGGAGGLSGLRTATSTTNVSICDGSVRAVSTSIKLTVWKALATRIGGEVIGPDDF
jgi:type II secretory pathway pseudopilin PulG